MNIVFIVGNGFDLNLGLKTSYRDFYKFYIKQESSSKEVIDKLKEEIQNDIQSGKKKWSDLELSLGRYTSSLTSPDHVKTIIFDIVDKLCIYLEEEQNKIDYSQLNRSIFINDLLNPEKYLSQRDKDEIKVWKRKWNNTQKINLHILTFNYTKTIEKILGEQRSNVAIRSQGNKTTILKGIEHIHGFIDERTVLGVNDVEQIENEEFRQRQEVIEVIVKPKHNQELGHTKDDYCVQQINNANLICVFGSSIGETDKKWWKQIGSKVGNLCRLIIFQRASTIDPRNQIQVAPIRRNIKDQFLSMTNLSETEKENAKQSIYVGINANIFRLQKNT